ncbi:P-loop containing nucleoside triphosphate hydrolase protein [Infundibulicybe gibba]|nr:P-loop containing nucleoside triphosphate hydrolase protein [Infundibulicybe gibba]
MGAPTVKAHQRCYKQRTLCPQHLVTLPNSLCPRIEIYPQVLALPIARRPLSPGFYKAVVVRNPKVIAAIKEIMKRGQPCLSTFLLKDENTDSDVITDISSDKTTRNRVLRLSCTRTDELRSRVWSKPAVWQRHRKRTPPPSPSLPPPDQQTTGPVQTSFLHNHDIPTANVKNPATQPHNKDDQYICTFMSEIVSVFKDIAQLSPLFRDQITNFSINQVASNLFDKPNKLTDFAAAVATGEVGSPTGLEEGAHQRPASKQPSWDVDSKIAKRQRKYHLMEQLKAIKKELGMESDSKDELIEKFKERAATLKMLEPVRKVFDEEISKFAGLEPAASEANVTRNYLEWLTQIPWGQHTPENYSITHAQTVLNKDHYGLKDTKNRILEFLAVGKLCGTVEGKITCLVGLPGVGKTLIGNSISRVLNWQFFRFSVGGLMDMAEIEGHRRTYIVALPGKIIEALKRVGTKNPLVLIDEVDKIGRGHNGDPASALLEMLDPEQNNSFLDHYMDVPVDLSRALFVCTANKLDTILAPLLDRMEVLEVRGYVSEEKAVIADKYLGPQVKEASGLKEADVVLEPSAIDMFIKYYCRESEVRNLKKHIGEIYRKATPNLVRVLGKEAFPEPTPVPTSATNTKTVESQESTSKEPPASTSTSADSDVPSPATPVEKPTEQTVVTIQKQNPMLIPDSIHVRITLETLKDYVGPPVYQKDRMHVSPPPPPALEPSFYS